MDSNIVNSVQTGHRTFDMIKKGFIVVFFLMLMLVIYSLIWGILFPLSPIKFGFNKISYHNASILYPKEMLLPDDYKSVDHLMGETERFHRLKFKKKVTVIICATKSQYKRYSTQRSPLCTMATGTIIYINPTIKDTNRDIQGFLKHELSHALIFQNTTFLKTFKIKRWLREGLAVFYGNPHHYYQGKDFCRLAVDEGYFLDFLQDNEAIEQIPREIRYLFEYAEYKYFIDYLVTNYGMDLFLKFINQYILEPESEKELFKQIYSLELLEVFQKFKLEVMNKKWPNESH